MCTRHQNNFLMASILLNCDLGENEPIEQTTVLLDAIDAASICCGYHAGNPGKTARTIGLAKAKDVLIGAHPGLADAGGRGDSLPSVAEFETLLQTQLGSFITLAKEQGATLAYVKLHGSLYHAVEQLAPLRESFLNYFRTLEVGVAVVALAGGATAREARANDIPIYEEIFADRAYKSSGQLVPRSEPGAVLSETEALDRFEGWLQTGHMPVVDGAPIELSGDMVCVHGDTPDAVELIRSLREVCAD